MPVCLQVNYEDNNNNKKFFARYFLLSIFSVSKQSNNLVYIYQRIVIFVYRPCNRILNDLIIFVIFTCINVLYLAVWCFFSGITKSYEITPVLLNIIQNYTVVLNLTFVLILFDSSAPVHWPQRRIYWPTWTSCIHNLVYMCWLHMDKNVVDATHLISHDTYSSLEACEPYHSQYWATMSNYISHGQESTISLL